MSLTKRLLQVARANLTDFKDALRRDELRSLLRDEELPDEAESVGGKVGEQARVIRDAAEDAWERAYEAAKNRTGIDPRLASEVDRRKWYRTLELEPGATKDDVRKAYRRLLRIYHPDRHANDPEKYKAATEVTRRITEAYEGLTAVLGG